MDMGFMRAALWSLLFIGIAMLGLAAWSLYLAMSADVPEGMMPVGEGSAFFILLAGVREIIGAIMRLTDGQREHVRDTQLFNSTNNKAPVKAKIVNEEKDPVPTQPVTGDGSDSNLD